MAKRSAAREEFLCDILHTAIEGGINDWAEVSAYKWEDLAFADVYATIHEMEEDDAEGWAVNIDVIAKGIAVIKAMQNADGTPFQPNYFGDGGAYWREFLKADRTNGEDGDYDAIIADWIVQAAIFGEIVYG